MKKWLNMSDVRNILYLSWEMASQVESKKKPVLGHNSISIGSTRNLSIPQKNIPRRKVAFPIQGNCTSDLVCGGFPLSARIYCIQFACTQAATLPSPPPPHLTQHCINSQNAFFGSDKQPGRVRCPFYLPGSLQEQHSITRAPCVCHKSIKPSALGDVLSVCFQSERTGERWSINTLGLSHMANLICNKCSDRNHKM